ncbi:MAG TPA: FAD binding domain-containing protein [Syntrophorhabdaceae bacterium]|nr:FAD binding domain-containing protein [Syntrophorhabdaceae bacterium]HQM82646.1 FAD binding domain-containing protein [Syntrophorhabdaceae bacterium]
MTGYEYYKPKTIEEAIRLMGSLEGARYIAGGTDVMVLLRQKKIAPRCMISLRNIADLTRIDIKGGLRVGSAVTHSAIEENEHIKKRYSALNDATTHLGSRQIRNVATIGGNICNAAPSADTACPLLVLDARAIIAGPKGAREVDLDDFFLGPGSTALEKDEIVKEFVMPPFDENTGSAYIKHTRRQAMDLPILGVAARITISVKDESEVRCRDMFCTIDSISNILSRLKEEGLKCEDARIAMGVVAPRPIRAKKAEAALKGKIVSPEIFEEIGNIAAGEAQPRDSIRGEAWYRSEMIRVLTKRALIKAIDRVIRPDEAIYPERLW